MKKTLFALSIIIALAVSPCMKAQETEEFKTSGKIFGLMFADYHNTFSGGKSVSVFEVTRSYLGYDYSFSKTISGRIMYDATAQSVGGKTIMTGYLRNAYLQYDNGKLTLRGGLIGVEQISVTDKFWNYRYISKPIIDFSGMIFPADLGIMAKYKIHERITIDMGILNGRGYKDITADTTLKLVSGITFSPVENMLFRAYYDIMGPSGRMQNTFSITGAYSDGNFTLGAEYLMQNNHLMSDGENYSGFSIFTSVKLKEKFSLFGRYDNIGSVILEGETDPWNITKDGSTFIFGADYSPVKNIRIAPNFTGYIPDDPDADFTGIIGLNIEARF